MTDKINATVTTRANVYFDGKCVSHSIELPDGTKKSVGVVLPSSLRFKIEDSTGEYCNTGAMPVMKGANSFVFADLQAMCWKPAATNPTGEMAKSGIVKIAWQVVTKMGATVPFNYCVSNVRALL